MLNLRRRTSTKLQKVLCEVWSKTVIDGHRVHCEPLRAGCEIDLGEVDPEWASRHVRQSRYSIQIVKCADTDCCPGFATNWMDVFQSRFIPAPASVQVCSAGRVAEVAKTCLREA